MFGLFSRKQPEAPAIDASTAARALGRHRTEKSRALIRNMTNQLRHDMRAKGLSDLPEIDWSAL